MNICVIGLGLIGGSFARAISLKTSHICFGMDNDDSVIQKAINDKVITNAITPDELINIDMCIVCLYPDALNKFILSNLKKFKKDCIIIDSCGIKQYVTNRVQDVLIENGIDFIGCHPMAGREFSGYDYSTADLFNGASFIMTPCEKVSTLSVKTVENLAMDLGFGKIVKTSPEEHDRIIAFTSQLAHVISSAYIKSPTLNKCKGFSAGSFQDLTRVARLNEDMWTDLFLQNSDALSTEIANIIVELQKYKDAIDSCDKDILHALLRQGRILKENS